MPTTSAKRIKIGNRELFEGADTDLSSADPADWPVADDWQPVVGEFFASASGRGLLTALQSELSAGARIFPLQPLQALRLTPLATVRVVLVGQDPYPTAGHADGLAFSALKGRPKSLARIAQLLAQARPQWQTPAHSQLNCWAEQGVLMLNTVLTVRQAQAGSHLQLGWHSLTQKLMQTVAVTHSQARFMLWGSKAQAFAESAFSELEPAQRPSSDRLLRTRHPSYDFDLRFMAEGNQFAATADLVDWWQWRD